MLLYTLCHARPPPLARHISLETTRHLPTAMASKLPKGQIYKGQAIKKWGLNSAQVGAGLPVWHIATSLSLPTPRRRDQIEKLPYERLSNPYHPDADDMNVFQEEDVKALSYRKWNGLYDASDKTVTPIVEAPATPSCAGPSFHSLVDDS